MKFLSALWPSHSAPAIDISWEISTDRLLAGLGASVLYQSSSLVSKVSYGEIFLAGLNGQATVTKEEAAELLFNAANYIARQTGRDPVDSAFIDTALHDIYEHGLSIPEAKVARAAHTVTSLRTKSTQKSYQESLGEIGERADEASMLAEDRGNEYDSLTL